ncbi:MAG: hypothetical protein HYV60_04895 [Planctomycetia bacterium]|nr:hypothetical protein [Planctomycetia bacterium]
MEPLDLAEYEWKIRVRQLTIDDFDALIAMQKKCFPVRGLIPRSARVSRPVL